MTILTAVAVRLAEEIALVHICMTCQAPRVADSEDGVLPFGHMAFSAWNSGMTIDKRVRRSLVALHGES